MKNKPLVAAVLAAVLLVVLVIVVAVSRSSEPAPAAAKSTASASPTASKTASPKPAAARTATPTPNPTSAKAPGITVTLGCSVDSQTQYFDTLQEVWATGQGMSCNYNKLDVGAGPSDVQKKALETAYGPDFRIDSLNALYGVCSKTSGIPIEEVRSGPQARELAGAYVLCPDHPKAAAIEATIAAGQALIAEEEANRTAIAEGRQVGSGKYLVGVDVQPGLWQSVGQKVADCYWEISDAQGNIIENNFISIAPQFTITLPEGAAGFTIQGCTFRKIG